MEMKKETKTYRFESEVIKHAEGNPLIPSFAEWACERYKAEFMAIETLAIKMNTYFDMAHECKERITILKKEGHISILDSKERAWFRNEAPYRIKRGTFEGVYKSFCNTFVREDINRRQFKLFIKRFESGSQ